METEYVIGCEFSDPDLGNEIIRHFPLEKGQRIEKRKKAGAFVMCLILEKGRLSMIDRNVKDIWIRAFIKGYECRTNEG